MAKKLESEDLDDGLKLSNVDKAILGFIKKDRYMTNAELVEKCGKSLSTIERANKYF